MLFPLMWGNYLEHFIRKWGKEGAEVINAFYLFYIPPSSSSIRLLVISGDWVQCALCILYCT